MPSRPTVRWAAASTVLVLLATVTWLLWAPVTGAGSDEAAEPSMATSATETGAVHLLADPVFVDGDTVEVAEDAVTTANTLAGIRPGDVPRSSSGAFAVAPGSSPAPGPGRVATVRVEVEDGVPVDVAALAAFVMDTLNDPRGWGADGSVSFARTDGPDPEIRVLVASAATVDAMCAPLRTNGRWSCGRYGHAALNADRWVSGAPAFLEAEGADLTTYRQYLVNHEVGHLLGHQHTGCPAPGAIAPVMLQQSIRLEGCRPNGWPNP